MRKGIFITTEGGEGAGKTSIISQVQGYLEARGYEVLVTREPGGIDISEKIRSIILDKANTNMDGRTEALLYAAARRQHLVEKVHPALSKGMIVLCDRFIDSSLAYQGYARGLGMDEVLSINQFAIEGSWPDLTLYFDLNPEIGLARIDANKQREINRLDLEELGFHNNVREGYLKLLKKYPERMHMVNAEQAIEQVFEDVINIVEKKIGNIRKLSE